MDELVIKIQIIPKPLSYWQTNDPVIPVGFAAYVTDSNTSTVKHGDGVKKWSQLTDTHADMYVPNHVQKHVATGSDPLIATNAEAVAGTNINKVPNVSYVKNVINTLDAKTNSGISKADTAQATANAANLAASNAQTTANNAGNAAVAAQNTANTAKSLAEAAQTSANAIKASVDAMPRHTISTAGPSGTARHGDIWWQYF